MKFTILCKRHYTNKDLLNDHFGRLYHLPVQLRELCHEGIVIAGDLHTSAQESKQINGVFFHSLPLSILTFYTYMKYSQRIIAEFKPDVLIASSDSYFGYQGLRLSKKFKIPLIFDVYDDYTVFGTNKIPGMKAFFYKTVEKSDLIVTSSWPLQRKLSSYNKNILVIENGFDPDLFRPISQQKCRQILNIPDNETVIGYFGSIAEHLGIETLFSAIEILQKQIPDLRFLLAGHNGMNLAFDAQVIDYRGFRPQQEIPVLINACDVVVIPYLPSKQVQQSNACKIAEYIACRVPIVVTNVSNHAEIFAETPQSLCNPNDPESMISAIQAQLKSPQLLINKENLTWRKLAEKLSETLKVTVNN